MELKRYSKMRFYHLLAIHQLIWKVIWGRMDIKIELESKKEQEESNFRFSFTLKKNFYNF